MQSSNGMNDGKLLFKILIFPNIVYVESLWGEVNGYCLQLFYYSFSLFYRKYKELNSGEQEEQALSPKYIKLYALFWFSFFILFFNTKHVWMFFYSFSLILFHYFTTNATTITTKTMTTIFKLTTGKTKLNRTKLNYCCTCCWLVGQDNNILRFTKSVVVLRGSLNGLRLIVCV